MYGPGSELECLPSHDCDDEAVLIGIWLTEHEAAVTPGLPLVERGGDGRNRLPELAGYRQALPQPMQELASNRML